MSSSVEYRSSPVARADIAVVGTTLAGCALAAIVARHGHDVVLYPAPWQAAPPAAVATIPYTSMVWELNALRFGVPALAALGSQRTIAAAAGRASARTRNLGFVSHRPGARPTRDEVLQFNVPSEHGESHLHMADVEAWALRLAVVNGARVAAPGAPTSVRAEASHVRLHHAEGAPLDVRCLVDASGPGSPLPDQVGLGATAAPATSSWSIGAHLSGLAAYDDVVGKRLDVPGRWCDGSLHHVVPGGWMTVLPLDAPDGTRRATSWVSLDVDGRHVPAPTDPDDALTAMAARFPDVAEHLRSARRLGPWQVSPLVQHRRARVVGDRVVLLDTSAARGPAVFSQALAFTADSTHVVARRLLAALPTDDLGAEHLDDVDVVTQGLAALHDDLAGAAIAATHAPELWSALARTWLLGSILATLTVRQVVNRHRRAPSSDALAGLDRPAADGWWVPVLDAYRSVLERALKECRSAADGSRTPTEAAEAIFAELAGSAIVPPFFGFGDPADRAYRLTLAKQARTLAWLVRTAPPDVKALARR